VLTCQDKYLFKKNPYKFSNKTFTLEGHQFWGLKLE